MKQSELEKDRIVKLYKGYESEQYQARWSINNFGNQFIYKERDQAIENLLFECDVTLHNKKILEVGCAGGYVITSLLRLGAVEENIHGIDIRSNRLNDAKKAHPNAKFSVMDASELNFPENSFDIIITFTLFSSILNKAIRQKIATELNRVLKPGGAVLYYDFRFNNPTNQHVIGIYKNEINGLFPGINKTLKLITLLPPLARRLGSMTSILYPALSTIPLLRSHYLGIFVK